MAPRPKQSSERRAAALKAAAEGAVAAGPGPAPTAPPIANPTADTGIVIVAEAAPAAEEHRRRSRRGPLLLLAAGGLVLLIVIGFAGGRMLGGGDGSLSGVVVGEPRGGVLAAAPEPTRRPTPDPTASPTGQPAVEPTATPAPVAVAPPVAATPAPAPVVTPAPPVLVAMAVSPDETVFSWYSHVESGEFDAAYSLWSDRMKANFPREGNLDNRWRDTADIAFSQLYVVSQTQTTATVQVDFVETRDDGSSRRFTGWWELVRSGDGWLLDQPHF